MTDASASNTPAGGNSPAPITSNSPFAQPVVPAPSGGDKAPTVIRTEPNARPTQHELANMTPQERWRANQPKPAPVVTVTERDAARREGRAPVPADDTTPAAPFDPANAEKVKVGNYEMTKADLDQLVADKATRDSIKVTLPTPEAYKVELPKDFKAPEGISFEFDTKDPAIAQARQFAHRYGLSQPAFSELAGIYAGLKAKELFEFNTARAAEVAKLGTAAATRVDAVGTWMKGVMGDDAEPLFNALRIAPVAKTLIAFEKLMQKWSSQGGASYSGNGREQAQHGLSDAAWNAMSFSQKREYTRNANTQRGGGR